MPEKPPLGNHPQPMSKESLILGELLAAKQDFASGNSLADRLGISRVAVWAHMEKLR